MTFDDAINAINKWEKGKISDSKVQVLLEMYLQVQKQQLLDIENEPFKITWESEAAVAIRGTYKNAIDVKEEWDRQIALEESNRVKSRIYEKRKRIEEIEQFLMRLESVKRKVAQNTGETNIPAILLKGGQNEVPEYLKTMIEQGRLYPDGKRGQNRRTEKERNQKICYELYDKKMKGDNPLKSESLIKKEIAREMHCTVKTITRYLQERTD